MTFFDTYSSPSPAEGPYEVVERKGLGHPDTLADALSERMSVAYSRYCRDTFGAILHHNLDKLYLRGGHARTGLGYHEMTEPTLLLIGGRVSTSFAGQPIDHRGLFEQIAHEYLADVLPHFDVSTWLRIEHMTTDRSRYPTWFHPESIEDLPEVRRPTASDTVAVTAWWPHTPTERIVLALERHLNQEGKGPRYTDLGQDIKVLARRQGHRLDITMGIPVQSRAVTTVDAYHDVLHALQPQLNAVAAESAESLEVRMHLNTSGDNPYRGKQQYLLGSGTCLEFGEEGFVGRGNLACGLVPIHRPKSVEAPYGKNPTYHAGKVYTIFAEQIARSIYEEVQAPATVTIVAEHSTKLRAPTHISVALHGPGDPLLATKISQRVVEEADYISLAVNEGRIVPR